MHAVELALLALRAWLAVGFVFALVFVARGLPRVDPAAASSGWGLRLLLIPGCTIFWPRLLWYWARGATFPVETSSHRRAAALSEE